MESTLEVPNANNLTVPKAEAKPRLSLSQQYGLTGVPAEPKKSERRSCWKRMKLSFNATGLEDLYQTHYCNKYKVFVANAILFTSVIFFLVGFNDMVKEKAGMRKNIALTLGLRYFTCVVGLGFYFYLKKRPITGKSLPRLTIAAILCFGVAHIMFGLIDHDLLDPSISVGLILIFAMQSCFFRLQFMPSLFLSVTIYIIYFAIVQFDSSEYEGFQVMYTLLMLMIGLCGFNIHSFNREYSVRSGFLAERHIAREQAHYLRFLERMLPMHIITQLTNGASFIHDMHDDISILFSHIHDFDSHTKKLSSKNVVALLNLMFSMFDALTDIFAVYKVETIGDVYLVSAGVPEKRSDHAEVLCVLGLAMLECMPLFQVEKTPANALLFTDIELRIGINSGAVIAGVVGIKYPRYRLMGDTINTASRMSTTTIPASVQISESTHLRIDDTHFDVVPRGQVQVKGKGLMDTFLIRRHHPTDVHLATQEPSVPLLPAMRARAYALLCSDEAVKSIARDQVIDAKVFVAGVWEATVQSNPSQKITHRANLSHVFNTKPRIVGKDVLEEIEDFAELNARTKGLRGGVTDEGDETGFSSSLENDSAVIDFSLSKSLFFINSVTATNSSSPTVIDASSYKPQRLFVVPNWDDIKPEALSNWKWNTSMAIQKYPLIEAAFQHDFFEKHIDQNRVSFYTFALFFLLSGVFDVFSNRPQNQTDAYNHLASWCIRIVGTCVSLAGWHLTFGAEYKKSMQKVTVVVFALNTIFFITIQAILGHTVDVYCITMLVFIFSAIGGICGLNFRNSVLISWPLLVCYVIISWSVAKEFPMIVGFMVVANMLFSSAAFYGEYYHRKDFSQMLRQQDTEYQTQSIAAGMLPAAILSEVQSNVLCYHEFENASVLFCDIVQFTALCSRISPDNVVAILNVMFSTFDQLTDTYQVYKVETIGDAYLACAGVVSRPSKFTRLLVECGMAFVEATTFFKTPDNMPIEIRVGIHTGPVIAGVVGKKMPRYHLFGETVTMAESMESGGKKGHVCISDHTFATVHNDFECQRFTNPDHNPELLKYLVVSKKNGRGSISQKDMNMVLSTVAQGERDISISRDSVNSKMSGSEPISVNVSTSDQSNVSNALSLVNPDEAIANKLRRKTGENLQLSELSEREKVPILNRVSSMSSHDESVKSKNSSKEGRSYGSNMSVDPSRASWGLGGGSKIMPDGVTLGLASPPIASKTYPAELTIPAYKSTSTRSFEASKLPPTLPVILNPSVPNNASSTATVKRNQVVSLTNEPPVNDNPGSTSSSSYNENVYKEARICLNTGLPYKSFKERSINGLNANK